MWILHFLPDSLILWFTNILLMVGVVLTIAGFFAQRIPVIWQYQLPFRVLGIALLTAGVYFRGGYGVETAWRERVAEVEAKLKIAQEQSTTENTRIETRVINRTQLIRERGEEITKYIDREVVKYDSQCVIPPQFIEAHNRAAEAPNK
jgi:hypothetical protein